MKVVQALLVLDISMKLTYLNCTEKEEAGKQEKEAGGGEGDKE